MGISTSELRDIALHANGAQVGAILNVDRTTPHQWVRREGAPQNADGSFSIPALVEWQVAKWKSRCETSDGDVSRQIQLETLEKLKLENQAFRGEQTDHRKLTSEPEPRISAADVDLDYGLSLLGERLQDSPDPNVATRARLSSVLEELELSSVREVLAFAHTLIPSADAPDEAGGADPGRNGREH